jgi:uncharacterized coiled-coil protein SlyX
MDDLAERIIELEIRYAYQSRLLEEFNQVLTESNQRLDNLERENRALREMVKALVATPEESPDE